MDETWVLAIDFGTTYTVAAARRSGRPPEVIEIEGERRVPSVVLIDPSGQIVVGRAAESMAPTYPDRTLRTPKYRLGIPTAVVLGGRPYSIIDLVAALLGYVYQEAVVAIGGPPSEVRLTYPASWSAPRRDELLAAASRAALPNPTLVPEPVAAAISYTDDANLTPGCHVLVYDLGGGTFDTAALRADDPGFVVIGRPTGDANLGGELFDELVTNFLGERLAPDVWEKLQVSDEALWQFAAASLRNEARRAKEVLSSHPEADVLLGLPSGIINQRLTKNELDTLIRPYIRESIEVMVRCATDAGLRAEDLDAVYLVGGASRSPIVREMVGEVFPQARVSRRGDPKAAVALGATHPGIDVTRLERRVTDPGETTIDAPVPATPTPSIAGGTVVEPARPTPPLSPPSPPAPPPPPSPPPSPAGPGTVIGEPSGPTPTPTSPGTVIGVTPDLGSPIDLVATGAEKPDRKKLALIGGGVLAAIALVAAIVIASSSGDDPPPPATTTTEVTSTSTTTSPTTTTTPVLPPLALSVSLVDGQQLVVADVPASGFAITGTTTAGASITVNGAPAPVQSNGAWQYLLVGLKEGNNPVTVVAKRDGNVTAERTFNLRGITKTSPPPPPPPPETTTTRTPTTTAPFARPADDTLVATFAGKDVALTLASSVLANDSGTGPLVASIVSGPAEGSASIASNGSVTYTPTRNGTFTVSIRYRACLSGTGTCGDATLTIRINCNLNFPSCI